MAKEALEADDVLSLIEQTRAWLDARATAPARDPVARQAERRVMERRRLGLAAPRKSDAARNRQRRQFLLSYLRQLPEDALWLWIDGLWLGHATEAQLAALVQSAIESARIDALKGQRGPREHRRPRVSRLIAAVHRVHDASLRMEWVRLTQQLKVLSDVRRKYHAPMKGTRGRGSRPLALRRKCLKSPIGQRVNNAGLFGAFFDMTSLTPSEMAARLLHDEIQQRLTTVENGVRTKGVMSHGQISPDVSGARATTSAAVLKHLPPWRILYRRLRQKR
jgi:hypothetical protein